MDVGSKIAESAVVAVPEGDHRYQVVHTQEIPTAEWDEFVRSHPEPYLEQMSGWGRIKQDQGWGVSRLCLMQDGRIVAGAQILELNLRHVIKIGYLNRGPLVADPSWIAPTIVELKALSRARGYSYLAVSLPYSSHDAVPALLGEGFRKRPPQMPPAVWVRATLVLDLTKDLDVLFSEMNATMRNLIRRSAREGVVVREGGFDDLPEFCRLVDALCLRRGVPSNMPGESSIRRMWEIFAPRNNVKLFMAESAGHPLCGLMVVGFGKWARAWRIGWTAEEHRGSPTRAVYWAAIQWCKLHGFEHFDVVGIDEGDARELLAGRPRGERCGCSITQFKLGLGGTLSILAGEYCYFPNPCLRWAFRHLAHRIFDQQWARTLANRLLRRTTSRT